MYKIWKLLFSRQSNYFLPSCSQEIKQKGSMAGGICKITILSRAGSWMTSICWFYLYVEIYKIMIYKIYDHVLSHKNLKFFSTNCVYSIQTKDYQ